MPQRYHIMKVGHPSRSMQWQPLHLKPLIETKANNSGGYTTTKMSMSQQLPMCPRASTTARQQRPMLPTSRPTVC